MQVLSITVTPTMQRKEPQPESASGNQQPGITSAAFGGETSK